jgi:hypothetical protein
VLTLVSYHADRFAANVAYQFADPPAVLVCLASDGFTVLASKGVKADLGGNPKFWAAVVAAVSASRPRPPRLDYMSRPGHERGRARRARRGVRDPRRGTFRPC